MKSTILSLLLAGLAAAPSAAAQEACVPLPAGTPAPAQLLATARARLGTDLPADSVLHYRAATATLMDYQSDRTYPPFFSAMDQGEAWYDPASGVERSSGSQVYPGTGPAALPAILSSPTASFAARDTMIVPATWQHGGVQALRPLNPWAVLREWSAAADVRAAGLCTVRDFPRVALVRQGPWGEQRLFVDPRTGYPVALAQTEPHYLWGQVRVEYVWSNWKPVGRGAFPTTAFRVVDGAVEISRTMGEIELAARAAAPGLTVPAQPDRMPLAHWTEVGAGMPMDTVRVGRDAFLLASRAYTEGAVLAGDTVYVLDATLGERRAREDAAWLEKLFPSNHPVAVVVTDLAWPHVAGVRWWVANGATIVSHRTSEAFLRRVVDRPWTLAPDLLEQRRASSPLRFMAVEDSASLGGGRLRLYAINGVGSEGALMAWLPEAGFLWAGDYVQTLREPSSYAQEVMAAARRAGIRPERVAAQHLPLTPWAQVEAANPGASAAVAVGAP
ncbi:hypothetical protein [Longimicrobium sp.]|uniref:hypothetical protein n=1 Tax=Longimicrobium sp. TaxID=2029185 RepID=UPI002E2F8159|nr:hypothetical protein [Longimicrobium sp.]HEX6038370.1 hypothetical protein [Longimicrobium sp.]